MGKIIAVFVLGVGAAACNGNGPEDVARGAAAAAPDELTAAEQALRAPREVLVVNPRGDPARTSIVGPVTIANATPLVVSAAGPTTVQGTVACTQTAPWQVAGSVDIGTPTVNAVISGTPSVAVVGTPTVNVASMPAVSIAGTPSVAVSGAVTVANTDLQPVPVRQVNAAPTPWVGGGQIVITPGQSFDSEQFFAVPPGKHLVIEAYNVRAGLPAGQIATEATLLATASSTSAIFHFPLSSQADDSATHDYFGTAVLTKVNVRAGAGVIVAVSRNATTGTAVVDVALSGHLVDL